MYDNEVYMFLIYHRMYAFQVSLHDTSQPFRFRKFHLETGWSHQVGPGKEKVQQVQRERRARSTPPERLVQISVS